MLRAGQICTGTAVQDGLIPLPLERGPESEIENVDGLPVISAIGCHFQPMVHNYCLPTVIRMYMTGYQHNKAF